MPRLFQWQNFFKILSKKEKYFFFSFLLLVLISGLILIFDWYLKNTVFVPWEGGKYREGVIGQPQFINPLYLSTNDIDRDLVNLLFSSLLKFNEQGKMIKDLARSFKIKENKEFHFQLKENLFWHDGQPLTIEDIIFTIDLIQNPQYKSPQRIEWSGVTIEKIGKDKISFHLQKKYSNFPETITHLKILPKHIFQDIPPEDLPWVLGTEKYLIGSGPFQIVKIKKDNKTSYLKEILLERNEKFYNPKPFLKKISFHFYETPEELISAYKTEKIDGFAFSNPYFFENLKDEDLRILQLYLPRYFALFFNLDNSILKNKEIRKALNYSINKKEILKEVFLNKGRIVESPLLASYFGFKLPSIIPEFNFDKAKKILEQEGFYLNKEGQRIKIQEKRGPIPFTKNLKYGDKGEEVRILQKCLAQNKKIYPEAEINGYFGLKTQKAVIRFQEKYTTEILKPASLVKGNGEVRALTRQKLNQLCIETIKETILLELDLLTLDKFPLPEMAEILKNQIEVLGIKIKIKKTSLAELQTNVLAKKNFEILLFGQSFGWFPDPFAFWHSSQQNYPGLNITGFSLLEVDNLLIKIRETLSKKERKEKLEKLQKIILEEIPAIFLVQNYSFYFLSPKIKIFSSNEMSQIDQKIKKVALISDRLIGIENWYLKTKRKWK